MLRRIQPGAWSQQRDEFDQDRINRFQGQAPRLIPMIKNPSTEGDASHASTDAWNFFTGKTSSECDQWRFKKWRNEITLRSVEMYSEYEPGTYIKRIAPTPLLMLVAKNDVVAVTDEALNAFNKAGEIKKLVLFKGNHFSAYTDQFTNLSQEACEWFSQHL